MKSGSGIVSTVSIILFLLASRCSNEPFNPGTDPGPFLVSFAPMTGAPGQLVTLSGENLKNKNLKVSFNGVRAEILNQVSDREVLVFVPEGATTGSISVEYKNKIRQSTHPFTITDVPPSTDHTILIHENQRVVTFILTQRDLDSILYPDKTYYRDLYKIFKDDFDFILAINNRDVVRGNSSGFALTYSNSISGIGLPVYNNASLMGSAGKLKTIITIPTNYGLEVDNWNMVLHELLHTWANYGIPTEILDNNNVSFPDTYHWGISGAGQILRGFDQSTLQSNVGGNPNQYSFIPSSNTFLTRYSDFELYLMGLIPIEEVTPFDVFSELVSQNGSTFIANKRTTYDQELIEETLGERMPSFADSQKEFRILIVVFSSTPLSEEKIAVLDNRAEQFFRTSADDVDIRINFWEATYGKATIEAGNLKASLKN